MKQKLTQKNLIRLIKLTKPGTMKRAMYALTFMASYKFCFECDKWHAGVCG